MQPYRQRQIVRSYKQLNIFGGRTIAPIKPIILYSNHEWLVSILYVQCRLDSTLVLVRDVPISAVKM